MGPDHAEIWVQARPVPVQHLDRLVEEPSPDLGHEKIAPDDLLLMGMMLYMEQGMVLEWLQGGQKREGEEESEARKKLA